MISKLPPIADTLPAIGMAEACCNAGVESIILNGVFEALTLGFCNCPGDLRQPPPLVNLYPPASAPPWLEPVTGVRKTSYSSDT